MTDVPRPIRRIIGAGIDRVGPRLNHTTDERLDHLHREIAELRGELRELRGEVIRQGDRVLDRVVEFEIRTRRDIIYGGDVQATRESNEFALDHFVHARQCEGSIETLRYALSQAPTGGMALEFGVATGDSLQIIAEARRGSEVYGFDSFEGLPEAWLNGMPAGTFAQEQLPEVPGADLVVGWFDDTLPQFLDEHPGPVDFVHVDSDLYSSAKTVLELVGPRLRPGSIVHFDEFYNYPGWERHEFRAWNEHVDKSGLQYTYTAYAYDDCQVTARIDGLA